MFFRDLERFAYALPDGDGRDYDDELGKMITSVQLEDRLGIDIGLPCPGFHFDRKLLFTVVGLRQIVPFLNGVHVFQQDLVRDIQPVGGSRFVEQIVFRHGKGRFGMLRTEKEIRDGVDRIRLKILYFELELHPMRPLTLAIFVEIFTGHFLRLSTENAPAIFVETSTGPFTNVIPSPITPFFSVEL